MAAELVGTSGRANESTEQTVRVAQRVAAIEPAAPPGLVDTTGAASTAPGDEVRPVPPGGAHQQQAAAAATGAGSAQPRAASGKRHRAGSEGSDRDGSARMARIVVLEASVDRV